MVKAYAFNPYGHTGGCAGPALGGQLTLLNQEWGRWAGHAQAQHVVMAQQEEGVQVARS